MTEFSRRRRTAARLAAIQALYEMDVAQSDAETAIGSVLDRGASVGLCDEAGPVHPDLKHLRALVLGVAETQEALDRHIAGALTGTLALDRFEVLLRAILRAGAFELMAFAEIPYKVVVNEYVDVAHAFFAGREPTLVNAVLDRLAARFRDGDGPETERARRA